MSGRRVRYDSRTPGMLQRALGELSRRPTSSRAASRTPRSAPRQLLLRDAAPQASERSVFDRDRVRAALDHANGASRPCVKALKRASRFYVVSSEAPATFASSQERATKLETHKPRAQAVRLWASPQLSSQPALERELLIVRFAASIRLRRSFFGAPRFDFAVRAFTAGFVNAARAFVVFLFRTFIIRTTSKAANTLRCGRFHWGTYGRLCEGGDMTSKTSKLSPEVRTGAVRLVLDHEGEHASHWAAVETRPRRCSPLALLGNRMHAA